MTEAMNFFQSLFSLNNFAPATVSRHESKLVKALIKEAKNLAIEAQHEAQNGETAQKLMLTADENQDLHLTQNLATIALWHFERSLRKYRQAAARYSEAGRVQTKNSRIFNSEAKIMANYAQKTESTMENLNDYLGQN